MPKPGTDASPSRSRSTTPASAASSAKPWSSRRPRHELDPSSRPDHRADLHGRVRYVLSPRIHRTIGVAAIAERRAEAARRAKPDLRVGLWPDWLERSTWLARLGLDRAAV